MARNFSALYVIFVIAFTLIACGEAIPTAPTITAIATRIPATPTTTPKVYAYKDLTVGMITTSGESEWRVANIASFRDTAVALGINLRFNQDRAVARNFQLDDFKQFIKQPEVNVIVIMPIEIIGWEELLQQAKDADKIVIIADRRVNAPENLYAAFVGNDFTEEGRKAGREMCKLLEGNEKKNVWELAGTVGSGAEMERGAGFRETAAQCGIIITNSQTGNFIAAEGKQVTEAWLKESRDVQGIFGQNDDMVLGAIEALKEVGLAPAKDVKIVSVDATSGAFKAMLNGDLNVTVECNPMFAPQVYEAALKTLNGETLPKWIPVQESVFRMDDPNLKEIAAGRKY